MDLWVPFNLGHFAVFFVILDEQLELFFRYVLVFQAGRGDLLWVAKSYKMYYMGHQFVLLVANHQRLITSLTAPIYKINNEANLFCNQRFVTN